MRLLLALLWLPACSTVPSQPPASPAVYAVGADKVQGLWVLQIRRQQWQPRDLEFVLRIEADGGGTATVDPVFIGRTTAALSDLAAEGDTVRFTLHSKVDDNVYRFEGRRDGGTLDGLVRWKDERREQVEPFTGYRREVRRFDGGIDAARFPVESDPQAVGVSPVLLDRLVLGAETARSDALIVLADGRLIAARTFGNADDPAHVGSLGIVAKSLADARALPPEPRPSDLAALGQEFLAAGTAATPPSASWMARPDPNDATRSALGYGAVTSEGEGILVYPEARLVVVRTLHRVENRWDARYDDRDQMEWLDEMADTIAVEKLGRATPK